MLRIMMLAAASFWCLGHGPAHAESFKGVCTVAAGAISAQRFATLKCYKASEPGDYRIRSTVWERDGKEEYSKLARHSGRRFTCTFTQSGSSLKADQGYTHYKMSDCR